MNLLEMKKKVLQLIEEINPNNEMLTDDPDISAKINEVINQTMFDLARIKKISRYAELKVEKDDVIEFFDIEKVCGNEVYQVGLITGVEYTPRANGTVFKVHSSGTMCVDCYVYPERIAENTKDKSYEFELSADVLEIMPFGVAGDLLKSDVSAEYGKIYSDKYEQMLQRLDPRYQMPSIYIEGGV